MTRVDLPYLSRERSRHGATTYYVRRYGKRIRIFAKPGSQEFLAGYRKAVEELSRARGEPVPRRAIFVPQTFGWLVMKYYEGREFRSLDLRSQRTRFLVIDSCLQEEWQGTQVGHCPLEHVTSQFVRWLRDRKATPGAANNRRKYLSSLFSWAVENGLLESNPARDVKRLRYASEGFHAWTVEEVALFRERWRVGTKARLALEMLVFLGVRRSDLITLGRQHVRSAPDGTPSTIAFVPAKLRHRSRKLSVKPLLPVLSEVLAASPQGDLTFLVNDYGRPFSGNGFGNWFREKCNEAGLPHCSAHGLRKASATLAAEAGATVNQLMALYDWDTPAMATHYTRSADKARLAAEAAVLLKSGAGNG